MAFYNVPGDGWESRIDSQMALVVRNHLLGANSHNAEIETTYNPTLLPVRRRIVAQSSPFNGSYSTSESGYYPSQHKMEETYRDMTEEEWADMELEIKKIRLEELAFLFSGIPIDVNHGERIAKRQQRGGHDRLARYRSQRPTSYPSSSSGANPSFYQPSEPVPTNQATATEVALVKAYDSNPCQQFVSMYSITEDKWHPFPATLDTGTLDNWICESSLTTLALEQRIQTTEAIFIDFGGKTVKSTEMVEISWCAAEGNRKLRTSKFRIANKSAPFDVVLGSNLLLNEEGILKFDQTAWVLAKKNVTEGVYNFSKIESIFEPPLTSRLLGLEEKEAMKRAREKAIEESKKLAQRRINQIASKASGQGSEGQVPGRK